MVASIAVRTRIVPAVAAIALVSSCATVPAVTVDKRPDGIVHLTCKAALPACLQQVEALCDHQRYAVLRAFDDHDYKGDSVYPTEFRNSEVFVRCGLRGAWGDANKSLLAEPLCPAPAAPPPPVAPPSPPRACFPGTTQACVGPGGCAGGQVCASDGATFGACDCGGAPATRPPS